MTESNLSFRLPPFLTVVLNYSKYTHTFSCQTSLSNLAIFTLWLGKKKHVIMKLESFYRHLKVMQDKWELILHLLLGHHLLETLEGQWSPVLPGKHHSREILVRFKRDVVTTQSACLIVAAKEINLNVHFLKKAMWVRRWENWCFTERKKKKTQTKSWLSCKVGMSPQLVWTYNIWASLEQAYLCNYPEQDGV